MNRKYKTKLHKDIKKQLSDPTSCPICMGDYKNKDKILLLNCKFQDLIQEDIEIQLQDQNQENQQPLLQNQKKKHGFHKVCILNWIKENPSCPICRAEINLHDYYD
ncbi:hypothetical protein PPERSA_06265 [Pseudocohnilembus persalinus]|uniref:Zinc finger RING-H2-type domain-containing protein n=1 Tax=Pseudocohnilembus persalinus TaxID=266149 RepID=A0A0V0QVR7_PSEPJ|nr:hypothetical protein PPERSA_06265 [Pseudocohnilembus persalinus]|eukprot:KRX06294.1 hypothetical protein PPERSA_06265 [Pseudocohnilembus persalinus]